MNGKGVIEWVAPPDQAVEILHKLSLSVIWFDASARIYKVPFFSVASQCDFH